MFDLKKQLLTFIDNYNSLQFLFHSDLKYICIIGVRNPNNKKYIPDKIDFIYTSSDKLYRLDSSTLGIDRYVKLLREVHLESEVHIIYV